MVLPEIYKLIEVMATREVAYVRGKRIATAPDGQPLYVTKIEKDYSASYPKYNIFVSTTDNNRSNDEHYHATVENAHVNITFDKDTSY